MDLMFLMETKCSQITMEKWHVKLGYAGKLVVESVRKSGGLCLMWSKCINVALFSYS